MLPGKGRKVKDYSHVVKYIKPRMEEKETWVVKLHAIADFHGQFAGKKPVFKSLLPVKGGDSDGICKELLLHFVS
jgi:hypothetical protein